MPETILYEAKNQVAIITLNRPKQLNSYSGELVEELICCLEKAEKEQAVHAVVLTGAGKAFCAGGDLDFLDSLPTADDRRLFMTRVGDIVHTIYSMSKPVVAMVNGVAAGAGFNLAISCDLVFAADTARFVQSFAKVGLAPDCGGFYHLPRLVGLLKAKELMFTADMLSAQEALALQLVNRVIPADQLYGQVVEFAERLASSAPLALAMTKKALNNTYNATFKETLESEVVANSILLGTADFAEGVRAFREKRAPEFTGK